MRITNRLSTPLNPALQQNGDITIVQHKNPKETYLNFTTNIYILLVFYCP